MVDRTGTTYEEAIALQSAQLNRWQRLLLPEIFAAVRDYILAHNRPARTPNDRHQVFRGLDFTQILADWPHPGPGYPQRGSELI